jgi:hypothetical protein
VSISPIFYEQLFHTKFLAQLLCAYNLALKLFWRKDFGSRAAHKMCVKLIPSTIVKMFIG